MEITDIKRGIDITMTGVTTGAYVAGLAAVVFVNLAASVTTLACVARIDIDDFYTDSRALVPQLGLELIEAPTTEPCAHLFVSPLASYTGEILQHVCSDGRVLAHFLRDTVISIPHKPLFPAGYGLESSSRRPGAFALEPTALELIPPFSFNYAFAGVFNSGRKSDEVVQTPVNTDNIRTACSGYGWYAIGEIKRPPSIFMHKSSGLYVIGFDVVFVDKPLWNNNGSSYTLSHTRNCSEIASDCECTCVEGKNISLAPTLIPPFGFLVLRVPCLYSGTSTTDRLLYILGRKLGIQLPADGICLLATAKVRHRAVGYAPVNGGVEHILAHRHCTQQPFFLLKRESLLHGHGSLWYYSHLRNSVS